MSDQSLDTLLRWLEREPADDPADDLHALTAQLAGLSLSSLSPGVALLALKGAGELGFDISTRIRARLQQATLPLDPELRQQAQQLGELLTDIAGKIMLVLASANHEPEVWVSERERCLLLLAEAQLAGAMAASGPPLGLWRLAHELGAINASSRVYGLMLALAAASPESSTPRELAWLADFLAESGAVLPPLRVAGDVRGLWWIVEGGDAAPVSLGLRAPASDQSVVYFDFNPLIAVLGERLRPLQLALDRAAEDASSAGEVELLELDVAEELVPGLTPAELLVCLRNLRERWLGAALRAQVRRPQHYELELCIGLRRMWEIASGRTAIERVSQWEVLNESAGGYALATTCALPGSALSEIVVGTVVGLRADPAQRWSVCMIRWVRSPAADRLELGLQLLAPHYHAVRLAFRGASLRGVVPALALPAMEPLRRQRALLAPAGSCSSRRFVLMRDGSTLYVAQGRVLGVEMQTAAFELFRYEIDPNPI